MTATPRRRIRRIAALLAGVSIAALLVEVPVASALNCAAAGSPPANVASPANLYEQLRAQTNAQLLSIGFLNKPVADACAWIYEVKVLTVSGSVVELDFAATNLELVGARGPRNDKDAAALVRGLGADSTVLLTGSDTPTRRATSGPDSTPDQDANESGGDDAGEGGSDDGGGSGSDDGGSDDGGSDDGGSGEGGSGSGSDGGDSEGGDSSGSGSDGDGGEGGDGGSGSGHDGEAD